MPDITVRDLMEKLPPAEQANFFREAQQAASFPGFSDTNATTLRSWRLILFDGVTRKYADRLQCYSATGKFPEQITAEKVRADRREGWLWLLVIALGLALLTGWMDHNGVHGCNDPDVVLGGCVSE